MGSCCCGGDQVSPEGDLGKKFEKGTERDLSNGPVTDRKCTDLVCLVLFIAHFLLFVILSFQGAGDGNPQHLITPRDYRGQYCGLEDQWNGGRDLSGAQYQVWTVNVTKNIDSVAFDTLCSQTVKNMLVGGGANQVSNAEYAAECPNVGSSTFDDIKNTLNKYTAKLNPNGVMELISGSGSILNEVSSRFVEVCASKCEVTKDNAGTSNGGREYIYAPAPDQRWMVLWNKWVAYANAAGGSAATMLTEFKFNALPEDMCPYDAKYCVLLPGVEFTDALNGFCTFKLDNTFLSSVTDTMSTYYKGLADSTAARQLQGGLDNAVGDFQTTWDTFFLVVVLSFVSALVFMVLLRFFIKPVVWLSVFLIFALFIGGGAAAYGYSQMCKDASYYEAAKSMQGQASGGEVEECGGYYKIDSDNARSALKWMGIFTMVCGGIWGLLAICFCNQIRLAVSVNKVAARFMYNTPHIVILPIVQSVVAICWTIVWVVIAGFLLSQVPEAHSPTGCFYNYTAAFGTSEDREGSCLENRPRGFVWKDDTGDQCVNSGCCWRCGQPRYVVDSRIMFAFFSFLWNNAFFVACGQCIIAGAVGMWFFTPSNEKGNPQRSKSSILKSIKTVYYYHTGSLAFGSFILAVVQWVKWLMAYLAKQAKAEHNKVMEYVFKCLAYLLCIFERCVKFLNKNAYIQIALLGTSFCTSAKNAFFLILRNAARFWMLASLGAVVHRIGKVLIIVFTMVIGFLLLQAMHSDDISTPVVLTAIYGAVGYFIGSLFMNVFGLSVDTTLQCFIATEEMGIDKDNIPPELQQFVDDTATKGQSGCCGGCSPF